MIDDGISMTSPPASSACEGECPSRASEVYVHIINQHTPNSLYQITNQISHIKSPKTQTSPQTTNHTKCLPTNNNPLSSAATPNTSKALLRYASPSLPHHKSHHTIPPSYPILTTTPHSQPSAPSPAAKPGTSPPQPTKPTASTR